jgi:hypothetical protein
MRLSLIALSLLAACTGKSDDTAVGPAGTIEPLPVDARVCSGFADTPEAWALEAGFVADYNMYSTDGLGDYWSVLDLTGDGLPDLIQTGHGNNADADVMGEHWYVWPGTGAGFGARIDWVLPMDHRDFAGIHAANSIQTVLDINGDGYPDLVFAMDTTTNDAFGPPGANYWEVFLSDGATGFEITPRQWSLPALANPTEVYEGTSHTVRDLDGDGRVELIETQVLNENFGAESGTPHWRVHAIDGDGFADSYTEWPLPASRSPYTGDYLSWNLSDSVARDVTGDGLPDLVLPRDINWPFAIYGEDPDWHWLVHVNEGDGFAPTAREWSLPDPEFLFPSSSADDIYPTSTDWMTMPIGGGTPVLVVSHDFELDAPFVEGGETIWAIFDATGEGYTDEHAAWSLPDDLLTQLSSSGGGAEEGWFIEDMDGDGCTHLVLTAGLELGHPESGTDSWQWWVYRGQ